MEKLFKTLLAMIIYVLSGMLVLYGADNNCTTCFSAERINQIESGLCDEVYTKGYHTEANTTEENYEITVLCEDLARVEEVNSTKNLQELYRLEEGRKDDSFIADLDDNEEWFNNQALLLYINKGD